MLLGPRATATPTVQPPDPSSILLALKQAYGLTGRLDRLAGEIDVTYRLESVADCHVVKLAPAIQPRARIEAQTAAMLHVAAVDPALPISRVVATLDGQTIHFIGDGDTAMAMRVLSYLPGTLLHETVVDTRLAHTIGTMLARLGQALESFTHPDADQEILWDFRCAPALRGFLAGLENDPLVVPVTTALDHFEASIAPVLAGLPAQPIHNDFNPYNLLVDAATPEVTGILDLGDMIVAPVICDVAVAASYCTDADGGAEAAMAALIAGYHRRRRLSEDERRLLPPLIALRQAMTILITEWRARRHPENARYILRNNPSARRGLILLDSAGQARLADAIERVCA